MRKRKYAWLAAVVLTAALLLTACGEKEPVRGTVEAPPEETQGEAEKPLTLGRMEGGTYTNAYAGFACDLDESWTFYSAEELMGVSENVKDMLESGEVSELMENTDQLTDMMAENVELMAAMNVLYTKEDMSSRLASQVLSEEEFLDATLEQQDMMLDAYAQMGMTDIVLEKVQVEFLGESHWALKTTAKTQGLDYYILQVFNYKASAYSVTLTCSSFVEDQTQAVLDLFYAAE